MSRAETKVLQYLGEAHASELGLIRVLQSQIAMTPRGRLREALEHHLDETRLHAERVENRLADLGEGENPLLAGFGFIQGLVGQALALGKTPLDLLRGSGGEEKVLKNAKDACATEALEIATYTALERLARDVDDETTAGLAASIREEEQRMLDRLLAEIPRLADAVVRADVYGDPTYDLGEVGAVDAVRAAGESVRRTAQQANSGARRKARTARKVPGVARAEGQIKGALASEGDLPIGRYDALTAAEIAERLTGLSQVDLAKVDAYERKGENRATVTSRIASLRGQEPWPGYDELSVSEIRSALDLGNERQVRSVRAYERAHKNRSGVISATERELAHANGASAG